METTSQAYEVREKLAMLEKELVKATPNIKGLLREIHRELKTDPELVTILTDEQCRTLIRGLKKQTAVEISTKVLSKTPKKAMNKMTVADL